MPNGTLGQVANTGFTAADLIAPGVGTAAAIGGNLLSNLINGNPVKLSQQQQQFMQQLQINQLRRQNLTRGAALPGMYETLGYAPDKAQSMANDYTNVPIPGSTISTGKARDVANGWVQGSQNPFDARMSSVDKQVQAGTLTPEEAVAQKSKYVNDYLTQLNDFSTQGGNNKTVAQQSYDTFTKYYGDPAQYGAKPLGYMGSVPDQKSAISYKPGLGII